MLCLWPSNTCTSARGINSAISAAPADGTVPSWAPHITHTGYRASSSSPAAVLVRRRASVLVFPMSLNSCSSLPIGKYANELRNAAGNVLVSCRVRCWNFFAKSANLHNQQHAGLTVCIFLALTSIKTRQLGLGSNTIPLAPRISKFGWSWVQALLTEVGSNSCVVVHETVGSHDGSRGRMRLTAYTWQAKRDRDCILPHRALSHRRGTHWCDHCQRIQEASYTMQHIVKVE